MSITRDELEAAFNDLYVRWQELEIRDGWDELQLLDQHGNRYLRIKRRIESQQNDQTDFNQEHDQVEEYDDEALQLVETAGKLQHHVVCYEIVHSPSYQVPVLYLSIRGADTLCRPTTNQIYDLLVPDPYKLQMQAVGVMGALSLTEHPLSGTPAYFVHPCRTQEVMDSLMLSDDEVPIRYLALWIGTIGASVGLNVPLELAERLEGSVARSLARQSECFENVRS